MRPLPFLLYFISSWLLLLLSGCSQAQSSAAVAMPPFQTEKFKLSAGPCAADGYWVTIQSATFRNSQGGGFPVPSGHTLRSTWGESGTSWAAGDEQQAVPERLTMLWFAYAENKFYRGEFALPQQKIYDLLKQGYWNVEKQAPGTYNEFTVCVLPKGVVVVWLTGGNQTLIGRFQAQEAFPSAADFERYYGDADRATMVKNIQAKLPAEVQHEIKSGTLSTSKWDEYLKKYPWQVAFNVPVSFYQNYSVQYESAEYTNYPLTRDLGPYNQFILQPSPKPVPTGCFFYIQAAHGGHYLVQVRAFDEAETQAAFRTLHQLNPHSPITLLVTLDKPFQKATLLVKNEAKEIALTKSKVEVLREN